MDEIIENNNMEIVLDVLCEYKVTTSVEMYYDYTYVMTNKEKDLQGLVKDVKAVVAKITNQESMTREAFKGL